MNVDRWPTERLMKLVREGTVELADRREEGRQRQLKAAILAWPDLLAALTTAGRCLLWPSLWGAGLPRLVDWCAEPVIHLESDSGKAPKTKREALRRALICGDGRWATVGECWLWVGGCGPIVDRGMYAYGWGGKEEPLTPSDLYPWPPETDLLREAV